VEYTGALRDGGAAGGAGSILPSLRAPAGAPDNPFAAGLAAAASRDVTDSVTWEGYSTARGVFASFAVLAGFDYGPPASRSEAGRRLALFAKWLGGRASQRGGGVIAPATQKNYMAGVVHWWRVLRGSAPTYQSPLHSLVLRFNTESSTYTPRERKAMTAAFFPALRKIGCPPHVYSAILFAFFFFLRVGEYAKSANSKQWEKKILRYGSVRRFDKTVEITLGHRKNNQLGYQQILQSSMASVPTTSDPARAWDSYDSKRPRFARDPDDFAFVDHMGRLLQRHTIDYWIKLAAVELGLNPDEYSSHSCRIGGASIAWRAGKSIVWIQQRGGWRSVVGLISYLRRQPSDDADSTDMFLGIGPPAMSRAAQDAEAELMSRHENDRGGAAGRVHRVEVESDSDCDGA